MSDTTLNGNGDDMDDLLDATLDDLEDMPEFKPFSAGAHRLTINWDYSKYAAEKIIYLKLTAIETVELSKDGDEPLKAGDTTNIRLAFKKGDGTKNSMAEGMWKEYLRPLQEHFKTSNNRETMDASQGCEVLGVTKIQVDSRDKNDIKHYTNLVSLAVI